METEKIILGGGCFWCLDAVFTDIPGIVSSTCGYIAGSKPNPTYQEVCTGDSGHVEVVALTFDNAQVSLEQLLKIFFKVHNPTTANQQGNDIGSQYRSAIFFTESQQQARILQALIDLHVETEWGAPITTEITAAETFYPAESVHQDYFKNNPNNPYCAITIPPKIKKAQSLL
jgi:peptide-methionine (S)-S-oxide reductase